MIHNVRNYRLGGNTNDNYIVLNRGHVMVMNC